jgi:hypothetical protein
VFREPHGSRPRSRCGRPPPSSIALDVQPPFSRLGVGDRRQLRVTGFYLDGTQADLTNRATGTTYATSDANVARVTPNGVVSGRNLGSVEIRIQNGNFTALAFVEVVPSRNLVRVSIQPDPITVAVGGVVQLLVLAEYDDGSVDDVTFGVGTTYAASPRGLVNLSPDGLVFGLQSGRGEIRATFDGQTASATLLVGGGQLAFLTLLAPSVVEVGVPNLVQVIANFTDGSQQDVTFDPALSLSTNSPRILNVSPGQITGRRPGQAFLTAVYQGFVAEQPVTVFDANDPVVGLFFSPSTLTMPVGQTTFVSVFAEFASGNVLDVSGDPSLTIFTNGALSAFQTGGGIQVDALAPGNAEVVAQFFGVGAVLPVFVTPLTPDQLLIVGPSQLLVMQTANFVVFLIDQQGNFTDVTFDPSLQLSVQGPLSVLAGGVVVGTASGNGILTAQFGGLTATKPIRVTNQPDPVVSIRFQPPVLNLVVGQSGFVQVIGVTASGAEVDLTFDNDIQYGFSGPIFPFPDVGSIRIEAQGFGQGFVEATYNGAPIPLSTSMVVNIGGMVVPVNIILNAPTQIDLNQGPVPYSVTVFFSDGSVQDVTFDPQTQVTSSDQQVLQVSIPFLVPISPGFVSVDASFQGISTAVRIEVIRNQPPILFSVSPNVLQIGSNGASVVLVGSGFFPGDQVLVDGIPVSSVFIDSGTIEVTVPRQLLTESGPISIQVSSAAGLSNGLDLERNTAPVVLSYSPSGVDHRLQHPGDGNRPGPAPVDHGGAPRDGHHRLQRPKRRLGFAIQLAGRDQFQPGPCHRLLEQHLRQHHLDLRRPAQRRTTQPGGQRGSDLDALWHQRLRRRHHQHRRADRRLRAGGVGDHRHRRHHRPGRDRGERPQRAKRPQRPASGRRRWPWRRWRWWRWRRQLRSTGRGR